MDGRFAVAGLCSLRRLDRLDRLGLLFYLGALKCGSMGWTQGEYLLAGTALPRTVFTQLPRILQLLQLLLDLLTSLLRAFQVLVPQPVLLKVFFFERHLPSEGGAGKFAGVLAFLLVGEVLDRRSGRTWVDSFYPWLGTYLPLLGLRLFLSHFWS